MPTPSETMDIYPIAQYLAVEDIGRRGLDGGGVDVTLPQRIYNIGKSIQRVFDDDPTDSSLTQTTNFLYALCGKYGLQALAVAENSGVVSSVTSLTSTLPLPLDFIVSGSSVITAGSRTVTISSFIGYNVEFTRGDVPQYTTNPGSGTYYSWNRNTGEFTLFSSDSNNGAAQTDERFRIVPIG